MATTTDSSATPRLRFPKFRDAAAWESRPLATILDYERPEKFIVSDTEYRTRGIPVLTANKSFILGYTAEDTGVYTNTPVIIFDDFTTDRKYVDFPFKVKSSAIKILRGKSGHSLKLIFELMGGIRFEPKEHKRYYISEYQHLSIALPDIDEQQTIADCLTSLDDVIAAQTQKVEALKALKRGLLQQLFPREGETVPRLRFPDFGQRPEWKVKTVGELYEFEQTTAYSRDQLNYETGEIRCIHYGDIHTRFATQFRLGAETVPFINSDQPIAHIKPDAYCRVGDLVLADASEDLMDVGKTIELVDLDGEHVIAGTHTILARQRTQDLIVGFGGYLFKSRAIRAQIEREAQGTKVMGISPSRLAGVRVGFPQDDLEQVRIADCLSSLDSEIAAQAASLAAVRTHKAGLMQQLFPSGERA